MIGRGEGGAEAEPIHELLRADLVDKSWGCVSYLRGSCKPVAEDQVYRGNSDTITDYVSFYPTSRMYVQVVGC